MWAPPAERWAVWHVPQHPLSYCMARIVGHTKHSATPLAWWGRGLPDSPPPHSALPRPSYGLCSAAGETEAVSEGRDLPGLSAAKQKLERETGPHSPFLQGLAGAPRFPAREPGQHSFLPTLSGPTIACPHLPSCPCRTDPRLGPCQGRGLKQRERENTGRRREENGSRGRAGREGRDHAHWRRGNHISCPTGASGPRQVPASKHYKVPAQEPCHTRHASLLLATRH